VKPIRQIEMAEIMVAAGNYSDLCAGPVVTTARRSSTRGEDLGVKPRISLDSSTR
jgi:hypothetical protein